MFIRFRPTQSRTQVNFWCELLRARRLVLDYLTFPRVVSHSSGALTMERFQLHENSCELSKKSGKKEKKSTCKACKTVSKFLAFSSPPSSCLFQLHIRHFKHSTFFEPRMATESALFSCYIVKYHIFSSRDNWFEDLSKTIVLACQMFTSGFRS